MADELLPYYERELAYIRRLGSEFAKANPKIAGRLRIGPESVEDPHVSRLIEAVAFLNARVRFKLDDDFPELTDGLLSVLYPHYLAPLPSMAIVQFVPQADLTGSYLVPRHTALETAPIEGEPCRFRTCYPTTLWPIQVRGARLAGRPIDAPRHPAFSQTLSVLRLSLETVNPDAGFSALAPDSLRFFLSGQAQEVYPLYQLIMNDCLGIAVADSAGDPNPMVLGPEAIAPVGFELDQGMIDYPARAFPGYRLLTEFFSFPQKFLFFELKGLKPRTSRQASRSLEVFFYLRRADPDLETAVKPDIFALGCTPMVNLFRQVAEPIQVTHLQSEYRVVPDARRPNAMEVYSVDDVTATPPDGTDRRFDPFYWIRHAQDREGKTAFWQAMRRSAGFADSATEVFVKLVDLEHEPTSPTGWAMTLKTTCLNRDLPNKLPFGGGQPRLSFSEGDAPLKQISCLTAPTPTLRPKLRQGTFWRLISHLNLNHLSLTGGESGAEALREILRLYDFRDSPETQAMIDGVHLVGSRGVARRSPAGAVSAMSRGVEVGIEFDESKFTGSNAFLLASVLERFLALYSSINSFTQLVATAKGKEGIMRRWPPRAGDKAIL